MSTVDGASQVLSQALEYAGAGWLVVPIHGVVRPGVCTCPKGADCPSAGKHPIPDEWQIAATDDVEQVDDWFRKHPYANVGIRLGERSGIIDIECDDDEAENVLLGIFDGEFPDTPTFAGKRGRHRLFKWRDDLPFPEKAVWKIGKLEFRTGSGAKGAQSVFPPSMHASGNRYTWLVPPSLADVAELPARVVKKLWNSGGEDIFSQRYTAKRTPDDWIKIVKEGAGQGERNNTTTALAGRLLYEVNNVFNAGTVGIIWELLKTWNKASCVPPQPEHEVWSTFCSVLETERTRRGIVLEKKSGSDDVVLDPEKPGEMPIWKMEIIRSDPKTYRIWSPLWSLKAPQGYVEVTGTERLLSAEAVRVAVADQAEVWLTRDFKTLWEGDSKAKTHALGRTLMEEADRKEAVSESKPLSIAAELIWQKLNTKNDVKQGDSPPGNVGRWPDGTILFNALWLIGELSLPPHKVEKKHVNKVLELVGVPPKGERLGKHGQQKRFRVMPLDAWGELERMIGVEE